MRLQFKLVLINAVVAVIAAVVLWQAYAGARAVGVAYAHLAGANLPLVAALQDMRAAATGIIAATNELGLSGMLPGDSDRAERSAEIDAGRTARMRESVIGFEAAAATHGYLMRRFFADDAERAAGLTDAGRDLVRAGEHFLAALTTGDAAAAMVARDRLGVAEHQLLDGVAGILAYEAEQLAVTERDVADAIELNGRLAAVAGVMTLLLLALTGWAIARTITRPINRLTEATARIAAGEPVTIAAARSRDEIGRLVTAFRSMTEDLARSQAQAQHQALHDSLTGLPNRVLLAERLTRALAQMRRFGGAVAVIFVDLDRFKEVNDSLGHGAGDALLREVAGRLTACVRETDTVARLGGDEFAIVQVGPEQPADAERLCRRLAASLALPCSIGDQEIAIGVSLGVALAPSDGDQPEALLKHADIALYQAKQAGRGTFRFFTEAMNRQLLERKALERDLRRALAEEELTLAFQPQIELATGRVIGAEALLRWRHPERGEISPSSFIPLAEETGLIVPIGTWVLRNACARAASRSGLRIAVNLSPSQFRQPDLVAVVAHALEQTGLEPERLELEVTEGVLITDTAQALTAMLGLKRLGVRIAMDDFGTGYSSLSYLRRFPFDKIKIDRSFIADLGQSADAAAIVRSVVGLGSSLGMVTNAEGVEDGAQADLLRAEGCDEVQGFHFARPMAWADLVRYLGETGTLKGVPTPLACLP